MTFFERILLIFCRILLILLLLWHSIINRHRYRCQKRLFIFADIAFWEYQIFISIYQFLGKVSGTTWEPWIHLGIHWDYFGPYSYWFFGQLKHWIRFLLTSLLGELFNIWLDWYFPRYLACIKEDAPASILLWSPLGTHIQFMNNEVKVKVHTPLWISFYPPNNKFKSSLNCFSVLWYQLPDKYQRHGRAIRYPGQECLSLDICSVTYISDVITRSCSCSWNVSSKLDKSRIYLHIYLVFSSCILGSHYFVNLLALKFFTINPLYKVGRWTQGGLFHYNTFDILKPWPGHWPGLFWESKLWFVMLLGMVSKTF